MHGDGSEDAETQKQASALRRMLRTGGSERGDDQRAIADALQAERCALRHRLSKPNLTLPQLGLKASLCALEVIAAMCKVSTCAARAASPTPAARRRRHTRNQVTVTSGKGKYLSRSREPPPSRHRVECGRSRPRNAWLIFLSCSAQINTRLGIHAGISLGSLIGCHVSGGTDAAPKHARPGTAGMAARASSKSSSAYVVCGSPCTEMFEAADAAGSGEVVLSRPALDAIFESADEFELQMATATVRKSVKKNSDETPGARDSTTAKKKFGKLISLMSEQIATAVASTGPEVPSIAYTLEPDYKRRNISPTAERLLHYQIRSFDNSSNAEVKESEADEFTEMEGMISLAAGHIDQYDEDMVDTRVRNRRAIGRALMPYAPPTVMSYLDPDHPRAECEMRGVVAMFVDLSELFGQVLAASSPDNLLDVSSTRSVSSNQVK